MYCSSVFVKNIIRMVIAINDKVKIMRSRRCGGWRWLNALIRELMILWRIWKEVKDMFKWKMMELSIGNFITGDLIINEEYNNNQLAKTILLNKIV